MTVMERVAACGIVPVIVLENAAQAVPTAKALLAGGIDVMEITFRTAAAKDAIAAVAKEVPEMLLGAGTVVTVQQLEDAVSIGARFIVCPGIDEELLRAAEKRKVPIFPGVVTPSEIMTGLKHGLSVFKFFPAENYGGLKTIKALCAPFVGAQFIPTGGVSEKNAADYFANSRILAVGGSWMATSEMIAGGAYEEITKKAAEAVRLYRSIRG